MRERRDYGEGTYLMVERPWGFYLGGKVKCADGKLHKLHRIADTSDTFFSIPAAVKVRRGGRSYTVGGYVTLQTAKGSSVETADDPYVAYFRAYTYGRNGHLLVEG